MKEEFLRKYYFVGISISVRKAICEFTKGMSETFHEAWERLRDLTRECPHGVGYLKKTMISAMMMSMNVMNRKDR